MYETIGSGFVVMMLLRWYFLTDEKSLLLGFGCWDGGLLG
jgi:hypothetical protein